jgi:hypothetical protein
MLQSGNDLQSNVMYLTRLKQTNTKRLAFILFPLFCLALDVAVYPIVVETRDSSEAFSSRLMLETNVACLGDLKTHRVCTSLDDIADPNYLSALSDDTRSARPFWSRRRRVGNVLAISIVPTEEGWGGSLVNRVLHKLASVSPDDRDGVIDATDEARSYPNDVFWYDIKEISSTNRRSFPVDHLLVLMLGEHDEDAYERKIAHLLELAGRERVSNLVVPCLGKNPDATKAESLSCADTYTALLEGLNSVESPRAVYFSLYKRWSDEALLREAKSLTEAWKAALEVEEKKSGALPVIYQADARLMLFFLSVCLLVCSYRVELSAKTFSIICLSFVPAAIELQDKLAPLLSEVVETSPRWVIKCVLLAVLSVGYLFFTGLDLESLFKAHGYKTKN